jgi:WD40 repeat protein
MCLNFSADDKQLATGSGDQTAHITDMETQKVTACLLGHQSSIKSVQWQSSNSWIVATSSRDGAINIWDLRTHNRYYAAIQLHPSQTSEHAHNRCDLPRRTISRPEAINQIIGAHKVLKKWDQNGTYWSHLHPGRSKGDASITSISFIPDPSREHLLVSTCEAEATIKLWDIRQTYTHDDKPWKPPRRPALGSIPAPAAHASRRAYGMSSLAFSTDASRFYALCRDHTIYAYATSHLILGDAPELSRNPPPTPRRSGPHPTELPTIGPLFALRHPALRASSFYIKLAVRRASATSPELLAVGSSHGTPVLFPTDERYHTIPARKHPHSDFDFRTARPPSPAIQRAYMRHTDDLFTGLIPYHNGVPLVRGHAKEVTGVAWTESGALCTVSDDFTVRMWRENRDEAARLRTCGDWGPDRWNCGWADSDLEERME